MIVVTAPTGNIGHRVVADLIAKKESVRLIVRDATKLPGEIREQAEVIEGSHGDATMVDRALQGADALFWIAPPDASRTLEQVYIDFTRPAVEAIRRHKVGRVVSITALGRDTEWQDKAGLVTASIRMDDLLMTSGASFRGLAMPSFMDNTIRQASTMKEMGMMFGTMDPDMKTPTTAALDMAEVAVSLLTDAGWSGQKERPLLGPEDLSPNEMAAIISEIVGREVRYKQNTLEAFKAQLLGRGVSASFADGYVDMMRAKGEGMDNVAERTDESRTPTTFRQWCETELTPVMAA